MTFTEKPHIEIIEGIKFTFGSYPLSKYGDLTSNPTASFDPATVVTDKDGKG